MEMGADCDKILVQVRLNKIIMERKLKISGFIIDVSKILSLALHEAA